ncbi:Fic family protein [Ancylobacter sp. 6x-1]|uniref:Fic family protein n=1 Tax=Ancylobacter crimeensis TaxID=2579147 RepID=A0ABT0DAA9_9HYPH|nr:Fic family protein [Ancylobacter crimeensis]MCK0196885.1 Fic family protein [Ancylobacter crimeensis]
MRDDNWELVNGPAAHHIEFLNFANQVNVIEALFRLLTALFGSHPENGCRAPPNARALKALHHAGTLFLLINPGEYRGIEVRVGRPDGTIVHQPPTCSEVEGHMASFEADLTVMWEKADAIAIAAWCLWRINWIHPFVNGNGRAARAFAYACLCLKIGVMIPGTPTVIDLIMSNKPEFEAALREADSTFSETGSADLRPMNDFIKRLFIEQLTSIPAEENNGT